MPDSDAVRSRRKRAHAKNDHRWCRDGCQDRVTPVRITADIGEIGGNAEPKAGLLALAQRLELAHQATPDDAALARVLKDCWVAIAGLEAAGDGGLEGLLRDLSA